VAVAVARGTPLFFWQAVRIPLSPTLPTPSSVTRATSAAASSPPWPDPMSLASNLGLPQRSRLFGGAPLPTVQGSIDAGFRDLGARCRAGDAVVCASTSAALSPDFGAWCRARDAVVHASLSAALVLPFQRREGRHSVGFHDLDMMG